jgi:hypothetical protein
MAMYMKSAPDETAYQRVRLTPAAAVAIGVSVAAVLVFGFWPRGAFDAALRSAGTLTQTEVPVARQ